MSRTPIDLSPIHVDGALERAQLVVEGARQIRREHRRRRRDDRMGELLEAVQTINAEMREIRSLSSAVGRVPGAVSEDRERRIRDASRALQLERRKLRKMVNATPVPDVVTLDGGWS